MNDDNSSHTYEAKFQRLAEVVESLEREKLGIEESLALFEEGMKLAKSCESQLTQVEARIKVLVEDGNSAHSPLATRGDDLPLEFVKVDSNLENYGDQSGPANLS